MPAGRNSTIPLHQNGGRARNRWLACVGMPGWDPSEYASCPDDPAVLGRAIRSHWAIENALHWVLDVTFREDDSRVRDRTAARNLALLRKIALNIVGRDKTTKASVRARRKKAAWNDAYMLKLLAG